MKNDPDAVLPLNYRRTTVGTGWHIPFIRDAGCPQALRKP